jgi:hypothetical protein
MSWSNIFQNLALFWVKNANFFAKLFGENILKIITSVPGHPAQQRHLARHGPGKQRLPRARRPVEQTALGRGDADTLEQLRVEEWQLDDLAELTNLRRQALR